MLQLLQIGYCKRCADSISSSDLSHQIIPFVIQLFTVTVQPTYKVHTCSAFALDFTHLFPRYFQHWQLYFEESEIPLWHEILISDKFGTFTQSSSRPSLCYLSLRSFWTRYSKSLNFIYTLYRAPLIGGPQVLWILFLLLLTASASTCLQHSWNLAESF